MIKLTLSVFVLTIIATGKPQEINDNLSVPSSNNENSDTIKELWLQQFQGLRRKGKPCRRRSNNNPDEPWTPSYSSQITQPLYETSILQPQALKNEEYRESQVSATTENEQKNLASGRRSNFLSTSVDSEDCTDQFGTDSPGPSIDNNAEKTALKIIQDCLNKKQKNQNKLGSSRRSMSDPDSTVKGDSIDRQSDTDDQLDRDDTDEIRRKGSSNSLQNTITKQHKLLDPEESTSLASSVNSLSNLRVCYACSTATNPSCWEPDQRTTIKYCRQERSCVTKTFGVKNQVTLIRDCANSCTDTSVPGIEPKYKTCKICDKDYCNSATGVVINIYSLVIILIISIVKCTY